MSEYKFNKEKLDFTEKKRDFRYYIGYFIRYLLFSIFLALVYYFVLSSFFDTPTQTVMIRENDRMRKEYIEITTKMTLLDSVIVDLKNRDALIYQGMFSTSPFKFADLDSLKELYSISDDSLSAPYYVDDLNRIVDKLKGRVDSIIKHSQVNKKMLRYLPSIPPIENFSPSQASASIGQKINPFYKRPSEHNGLDIVAAEGINILAPADGIITSVKRAYREDGNILTISHGDDFVTKYAHLGDILVRNGRRVKRGDVIARVGNTGISFAPHLHYEVWYKGEVVDPSFYFFQKIGAKDFLEVLMHVSNSHQSFD